MPERPSKRSRQSSGTRRICRPSTTNWLVWLRRRCSPPTSLCGYGPILTAKGMECSHRQQPTGDHNEGDKVMMKDRQWARLAGVSGILFVVLVYAGVFLVDTGILGGLGEPPPDAGGEE